MGKIVFITGNKEDQASMKRANALLDLLTKEQKVKLSSEVCSLIRSTGIMNQHEMLEYLQESEQNCVNITASGLVFLVELEKIGLITVHTNASKKTTPNFPQGRQQTFGEKAVGIGFNPSKNPKVQQIKESYAKTIDYLENERNLVSLEHTITGDQADSKKERLRQLSIAITEAQTSQMWAVKALTWR